jgi:esterase/lipase
MKFLRILLYIAAVLTIVYLFGPKPEKTGYGKLLPAIPGETVALENYIRDKESKHKLKPGNEAGIVWFDDSAKQKTEYAIVYLHGFSASQEEGNPVHRNIARKYGCNLYLSRLAEHGIDTVENMVNLTADKYWQSAKEAFAIGKQLGKKIILMGTSTGGSNTLQLAAAYPDDVEALILLSPNIAINDKNAWVVNNHWGLQAGRLVTGSDYVMAKDQRDIFKKYWYAKYRLESVAALQEMLESSMTPETFGKIKQPVLLLYYYKDEVHQDSVVKVSAMLEMFDQLGTAADKKRKQAMPETGDHVLGSPIKSKDVEGVEREIEKFMKEVMKMDIKEITRTK